MCFRVVVQAMGNSSIQHRIPTAALVVHVALHGLQTPWFANQTKNLSHLCPHTSVNFALPLRNNLLATRRVLVAIAT
jgi:hypothetical protein